MGGVIDSYMLPWPRCFLCMIFVFCWLKMEGWAGVVTEWWRERNEPITIHCTASEKVFQLGGGGLHEDCREHLTVCDERMKFCKCLYTSGTRVSFLSRPANSLAAFKSSRKSQSLYRHIKNTWFYSCDTYLLKIFELNVIEQLQPFYSLFFLYFCWSMFPVFVCLMHCGVHICKQQQTNRIK